MSEWKQYTGEHLEMWHCLFGLTESPREAFSALADVIEAGELLIQAITVTTDPYDENLLLMEAVLHC